MAQRKSRLELVHKLTGQVDLRSEPVDRPIARPDLYKVITVHSETPQIPSRKPL